MSIKDLFICLSRTAIQKEQTLIKTLFSFVSRTAAQERGAFGGI